MILRILPEIRILAREKVKSITTDKEYQKRKGLRISPHKEYQKMRRLRISLQIKNINKG